MGCRPVSSRLITIRLRAVPFSTTIVQAYVPTSDYDDNETEEFCNQQQNVIDQTPKKDFLVVQEDWNEKVGKDASGNWQGICGPFCNDDRDAPLTILCWQTLLVITNNPEDGPGIAQMNNTTTRLITFE